MIFEENGILSTILINLLSFKKASINHNVPVHQVTTTQSNNYNNRYFELRDVN